MAVVLADELAAGGLEAMDDDFGHALEEFVAEVVVGFAFLAQGRAIEEDRVGGLDGAGIEVPVVGRKEPGPAEHVTGADGFDGDVGAIDAGGEEFDFAAEDEVETVGGIAFAEDDFARLESGEQGAFAQETKVMGAEAFQKGMAGHGAFEAGGAGGAIRRVSGDAGDFICLH